MGKELSFMGLVEIHERRWGTRQYPGRPSLKEIMELPIVAVWACKANFTLTVYRTAEELHKVITGIVTGKIPNPDHRVLARIYYRQQRLDFALQVVQAHEPPRPEQVAQPEHEEISDISRGAAYRPGVVDPRAPFNPLAVDANFQMMPRIIEARRYVPKTSFVVRGPLRARNNTLPGRNAESLRPKKD
jgi:hypothetical protein